MRQPKAFVQDVHLLIATDEQLHQDLLYVSELLASPRDSSKSTASQKKLIKASKPCMSLIDRRKIEIQELRRQVDILKVRLLDAQQTATGKPNMGVWERAARDQIYAYSKSLNENELLRADIQRNAAFIEEIADVSSEEWRTYKLAAHALLRIAAIHAIAGHQYDMLETAFIKAGLVDRQDEIIQQADGSIIPERVYHVTLAAPFRLIGAAVWKVFNGGYSMPIPEGTEETLEIVDAYTVYQTFKNTGNNVVVHANVIYKYYVEMDREVVVWRSVLEDELMPHMKEGSVQNKWGWLVVAPTKDATSCRLTYLHQVSPLNQNKQLGYAGLVKVKKVLKEKYGFIQPPEIPGTFPGGAVNEEVVLPIQFASRAFVERDKALEWTLKRVIDNIVFDFQQINQSPTRN
ncbi:unnamed protein product [Aphanomyces euteiches]